MFKMHQNRNFLIVDNRFSATGSRKHLSRALHTVAWFMTGAYWHVAVSNKKYS